MKALARSIVGAILASQVRRLRRKADFVIIGVVGSIGKTSTKHAIAQTLGIKKRVRFQEGNYNDYVSVPLVFFGQSMPSLFNPFAWLAVFLKNEKQIRAEYPFDVVVVELGTDGPGQIAPFSKYLQLDVAVVTAITPEHMEYFTDLDAVAKEELSVTQFAKQLLINKDLIGAEYQSLVPEAITYSIKNDADYRINAFTFAADGADFQIHKGSETWLTASHTVISEPELYSITAAAAVADGLGLEADTIINGLSHIAPVSGRMNRLEGIQNSTIIDDSYNSSPEAARASLETLYRIAAPQKIALLGNMNELGTYSQRAHEELGALCDPKQLDLIVTLGPDANTYTAPTAEAKGCTVKTCVTPYEAGDYLKSVLKEGALVLVKGSQNNVFAEEAIKSLLANPEDEQKLVRQSPEWIKKKEANFTP